MRERERERESCLCVFVRVCMCRSVSYLKYNSVRLAYFAMTYLTHRPNTFNSCITSDRKLSEIALINNQSIT